MMARGCLLPSPVCIPVPLTRCLREEDDDELSGSASTGNAAQRSGSLLAKLCATVGGGTGVLGGFSHTNGCAQCPLRLLPRQQP